MSSPMSMTHRLPVQFPENNLPVDHGSRICGDSFELQKEGEKITTEPSMEPTNDEAQGTSRIGHDGECFAILVTLWKVDLTTYNHVS